MPALILLVGILLILAGISAGWGRAWASAGVFFIVIGLSASLINLANTATGPLGVVLKHPAVSILILVAIFGSLLITVWLALTG